MTFWEFFSYYLVSLGITAVFAGIVFGIWLLYRAMTWHLR